MNLDPTKVDENIDILIRAMDAYNAAQTDEENCIGWGPGYPDWSSTTQDFALYPADYQRFIEKVGWLDHSPGSSSLNVYGCEYRLGDLVPDEGGDYEVDFLDVELELRGMKDESTTISVWAESKGIADYLLVAGDPCGYEYLALDKSTKPYRFIELIAAFPCDSFLWFVIGHLFSEVIDGCEFHEC